MFVRKGERLGSVLADKASTEPAPQPEPGQLTETEQEADRQAAEARESPEEREDGVHSVGGGWYEVVVAGAVIEKVRGVDAAQETYQVYQLRTQQGSE